MTNNGLVLTILGSSGGVAKSILSILNKSAKDKNDPIHPFVKTSEIHLLDIKQKKKSYYQQLFPHLSKQFVYHQLDLRDLDLFKQHLTRTKTNLVVDVSWGDTLEMLDSCNQLNIPYINTALENTMIDENEELYEGFGLIERIRLVEEKKNNFTNAPFIIGSGMNPGVVQWMAIKLLQQDPTGKLPIACYIVEHDNSFLKNKKVAKENVVYTTWSPECFLDEAILSYPMFVQHHLPLFFYENVYDLEFKVTLGTKQFMGCLMPHEEVYTLGKLYDMEIGFLYKVNDHTTNLIHANIDDLDRIWDFEMKVMDPMEAPLEGEDLVGVLLVYEDKERYMYNVLSNEAIFKEFKTNATYFQVACGIYASMGVILLDNIPNGAYYVDELLLNATNHYEKYLTYYMKDFVVGENNHSDGLLYQRMIKRTTK